MKNSLNKFYQDFHGKHEKYGFAHHLSTKTRYFQAAIGQGKKILDLGCRDGTITKIFLEGNDVTCIDVDARACQLCRNNLQVEVIWHDLNELLPLLDESYDVVVLSDVLEHIFMAQQLISEIKRVLKPGGIFLGSTPNAYYWTNRIKMVQGIDLVEYMDVTHVHFFSLDSLKGSLNVFSPTEIIPYGKHSLRACYPKMFASDFFWKSEKR